jgi:hypothetical protein
MLNSNLTPFEESLLRSVKLRERNACKERNRVDAMPNAKTEHFEATKELKNLLSQLRQNGRKI